MPASGARAYFLYAFLEKFGNTKNSISREEQGPPRSFRDGLRSEFDGESFPGGPGPGDLDLI